MGFERMCGIINGPNTLGVATAFFLIIMIFAFYYMPQNISKIHKCILLLTILLNAFCLILTFSRAGWAIVIISYAFILYRTGKIAVLLKSLLTILCIIPIIVWIATLLYPEVFEIISATFTGDESSAASRSEMVFNSYTELFANPLGNGVGASRRDNHVFAESSFLNVAYDIGIQGFAYLILMWIFFYMKIIFNGKNLVYIVISGIFTASIIACFVSVNPFDWPYFYYLWGIIGLGLNPSFKSVLKKNL
jgi:hypothetical protein